MSEKREERAACGTDLVTGPSLLEEALAQPLSGETHRSGPRCVIGECLEERHPTLIGRIKALIAGASASEARWVATLSGLAIRAGDRVLMMRPDNSDEWIVTGVLDGFRARPRPEATIAARVELRADEAVQVLNHAGAPLIEVSQGAHGAVVRLIGGDVTVETEGRLALRASSIAVEATGGDLELRASEDVVATGELVRLNS